MPNPFIHVELASTNVPQAKAFYARLFDWELKDLPSPTPAGTYTLIEVGRGTRGGIMQQVCPDAPSAWLPYVLVADVKASTSKARKLGATIVRDCCEVPGMGWFSIIMDPTGAALGMWQARDMNYELAQLQQ